MEIRSAARRIHRQQAVLDSLGGDVRGAGINERRAGGYVDLEGVAFLTGKGEIGRKANRKDLRLMGLQSRDDQRQHGVRADSHIIRDLREIERRVQSVGLGGREDGEKGIVGAVVRERNVDGTPTASTSPVLETVMR